MVDVPIRVTLEDLISDALRRAAKRGQGAAQRMGAAWEKAGRKIKAVGEGVKRVGTSLSKLSAPIALVGGAAIKMAADWERSLVNVATLIKGDATQAMAELDAGMKQILDRVPKSADDLGASLYTIFSAGINQSAEALATLEASGRLAVAGLGETSEATNLMTIAINAFGLDASKAEAHADVLFKTVKNGITTVSALSTNFGQAAGQAAAIGVSFEELQASTAALTSVTGKTAQSQTQLAALFREIGDDGGVFDKALQEMGSSTKQLRKEIGDKGLGAALGDVAGKLDDGAAGLKNMVGSSEAGFAAFSLLTSANEKYVESLDDMLNGTNSLDEAFKKQRNTAHAAWQILKNKLTVAMVALGSKILPVLIPVVEKVSAFIGQMAERFEKLSPNMQLAIIAVGAFVAVLGPAVLVLGAVISAIGSIVTAVGVVAGAIGAVSAPVLAFIAAIAAAAAFLAVAWSKNWADIQGKATAAMTMVQSLMGPIIGDIIAAWETLSADIIAAWEQVEPTVGPMIDGLVALFDWAFPYILAVIEGTLGTAWNIFATAVEGWYLIIKEGLGLLLTAFEWLNTNVGPVLGETLHFWVTLFQEWGPKVKAAVVGTFNEIKAWISGLTWESAGKGLMRTFANGIINGAVWVVNAVKNAVAKARALLPGSDAKEGPLSDLTASGEGMMRALGDGIAKGTPKLEQQVAASMARVMVMAEAAMAEGQKKLSKRELASAIKSAERIAARREFDNLDKVSQLEQRAAEEIALVRARNMGTFEVEKFWADRLGQEREKQALAVAAQAQRGNDEAQRIRDADLQAEQNLLTTKVGVLDTLGQASAQFYAAAGERVKAFFYLEKAAAIASALINANLAATNALATTKPAALGIALAAAIYAQAIGNAVAIGAQTLALAKGGIVSSPTMALIGERGTEVVAPIEKLPGLLGMGKQGASTMVVNFTGPFLGTPHEAARHARAVFESNKRLGSKRA